MKKILLSMVMFSIMTSVSIAQDLYVTQDGYLASLNKNQLSKVTDYLGSGDKVAVNKLVESGVVFWLKAGLIVYLEDFTWTGLAKIRPKGETFEVWTYREAIKKK